MDHKEHSLEEGQEAIKSINRDEKQVLIVAPLNSYESLSNQIGDYIMEQINTYVQELRALEEGEDLKHLFAMVVFKENDTSEEKKRDRKTKSVVLGSTSFSFELPHFCFDNLIDVEKVLASPPKKNETYGKDVDVTPLADRRYSIIERANNWTIELRKRTQNRTQDIFYTHLPSKKQFRSKLEVIKFILYETRKKRKSNKRKSIEVASECDVTCLTLEEINNKRKTDADIPQEEIGMKMIEWFPKEIGENNIVGDSMEKDECKVANEEQKDEDFFEGVENFCLDNMSCPSSNVTIDQIIEGYYFEDYSDYFLLI